jgi:hypothetical protein
VVEVAEEVFIRCRGIFLNPRFDEIFFLGGSGIRVSLFGITRLGATGRKEPGVPFGQREPGYSWKSGLGEPL